MTTTTEKKKKYGSSYCSCFIHILNFKILSLTSWPSPSVTDGWTDRPKPICPLNFFEVGGIKKERQTKRFTWLILFILTTHDTVWDGPFEMLCKWMQLLYWENTFQLIYLRRILEILITQNDWDFTAQSTLLRSYQVQSQFLGRLRPPRQLASTKFTYCHQ